MKQKSYYKIVRARSLKLGDSIACREKAHVERDYHPHREPRYKVVSGRYTPYRVEGVQRFGSQLFLQLVECFKGPVRETPNRRSVVVGEDQYVGLFLGFAEPM